MMSMRRTAGRGLPAACGRSSLDAGGFEFCANIISVGDIEQIANPADQVLLVNIGLAVGSGHGPHFIDQRYSLFWPPVFT